MSADRKLCSHHRRPNDINDKARYKGGDRLAVLNLDGQLLIAYRISGKFLGIASKFWFSEQMKKNFKASFTDCEASSSDY